MRLPWPVFQELPRCPPILRMFLTRLLMVTRRFYRTLTQKQKIQMKETAMKSSTPETELQPSTQLRKVVFGGSLMQLLNSDFLISVENDLVLLGV